MYSERCDKYYNLTLVEERQGHPGWGKGGIFPRPPLRRAFRNSIAQGPLNPMGGTEDRYQECR
jgi:hypothetical protein